MVGLLRRVGKIHRAPFNVEYPIGRRPRHRSENTAGAPWVSRATNPAKIIRALVIPVREHRIVMGEPRQANVSKVGSHGRELGIAIGRQIDRSEALVVQRVREWQRNGGDGIIPVIADVGRAWHDAAAYLIYHVQANARRGR